MEKNNCEYEEDGYTRNNCEDFPITYCQKCGKFYSLDKEGNRTQINLKVEGETF